MEYTAILGNRNLLIEYRDYDILVKLVRKNALNGIVLEIINKEEGHTSSQVTGVETTDHEIQLAFLQSKVMNNIHLVDLIQLSRSTRVLHITMLNE